jgi:hypothetical protein
MMPASGRYSKKHMLQAVTRDILKPVVAAMIRDEINAKKS